MQPPIQKKTKTHFSSAVAISQRLIEATRSMSNISLKHEIHPILNQVIPIKGGRYNYNVWLKSPETHISPWHIPM